MVRNGRKSIPQLNLDAADLAGSSDYEALVVRNLFRCKYLITDVIIVDFKSAYAGSIPTSASTLRNPVD